MKEYPETRNRDRNTTEITYKLKPKGFHGWVIRILVELKGTQNTSIWSYRSE